MLITEATFDKALEIISQCDVLAIDTETFWVDQWHKKRIMGVAVYCELEEKALAAYFPFRHKTHDLVAGSGYNLPKGYFGKLVSTLNHDTATHLFHNAPFDRSRFILERFPLTQPFFCTLIMSHMAREWGSHELEDLAEEHGIDPGANERKRRIHESRKTIGWECIPVEIMSKYACGDVRNTYKLWQLFSMKLKNQEMYHLLEDEFDFSDALTRMISRGIVLNVGTAQKLSEQASYRMKEIKSYLGFDPMKPKPLADKLFGELGFTPVLKGKKTKEFPEGKPVAKTKQFPNGRPVMAEPILEKYKHPVVDHVLEYRGLVKAKGTWYDGFTKFIDNDSRIHPGFNQTGTRTSRLSCSEPNVQQLPRDVANTPVKTMLEAPFGYELIQFDYSQLEYRLAAVYSGDSAIIEAYLSGSDFHTLTASRLGVPRQLGKTINFAILYGATAQKIAEVLGVSLADGREIHSQLKSYYPKLFQIADRVNGGARRRGYVKLWTGRRCHFQYHWESRLAWNTLIQGGGAEVCKYGILRIHRASSESKAHLVSQIHDAVWAEIPVGSLEDEVERIKYHLEWPSRDTRFKIPFIVDVENLTKSS